MTDADTDAVLALNEASVVALSPLDFAGLQRSRSIASAALVGELDGQVVGFAIAYAPRTAYTSINYLWHAERFDDFLYLDRITVGAAFRRRGVANALYDAIELLATPHGRMVCEINSEPPNPESLAFHTSRGYRPLGHLTQPDGHVTVMMEKPLWTPTS